jgi:hypothetical protein
VSDFESCHREVARHEVEKGGGLEGRLNRDYLRLIPGLGLEDRMN